MIRSKVTDLGVSGDGMHEELCNAADMGGIGGQEATHVLEETTSELDDCLLASQHAIGQLKKHKTCDDEEGRGDGSLDIWVK